MKRYSRHVVMAFLVLLSFSLVIFSGCGSSGQAVHEKEPAGDIENIDALLGLTTDDSSEDTRSDSIAEDDVLKLLGVTENSSTVNEWETVGQTTANRQDLTSQNIVTDTRATNTQQAVVTRDAPPAQPNNFRRRGSFQERYNEALAMSRVSRDFRTAIQMFGTLLNEDMDHSLSDNCQYWIGECYDALGDYQQAAVAFEKVFTFNNSNKEPDAQLKLGICYLRMKDNVRAKRELQKFIDNYPTSENVSLARQFLDRIK